jgi:hypothetical protein
MLASRLVRVVRCALCAMAATAAVADGLRCYCVVCVLRVTAAARVRQICWNRVLSDGEEVAYIVAPLRGR